MLINKKYFIAFTFLLFAFTFSTTAANAQGKGYSGIVYHLKTKYQAKKVSIPFMFLARFAVNVVRPAGVKSFNITLFEDLKFSRETLDREMQAAMRNSMSLDWSPIFHVRSRDGQQAYMYMRESGDSVKIMLVTIDKEQAAVIRATFSPERLADFINDPKIFGISLNDNEQQAVNKSSETKKNGVIEQKTEESKKDN